MRNALERGRPTKFVAWGLPLWVRGDMGVSLNAGNASAWASQMAGAVVLSQAVAGQQPLYVLAGQYNRNTLRTDGVDDLMQSGAYVDTEPTTLFSVWKTITLTVAPNNDCLYDGRNDGTMYALNRTANYAILNSIGTGLTTTAVPAGAFHRGYAEYNGATSVVQVDNNAPAAGTLGGAGAAPGGFTFGARALGGRAHNGEYGEFIQFTSLVNASVKQRINNYQRAFWGLA